MDPPPPAGRGSYVVGRARGRSTREGMLARAAAEQRPGPGTGQQVPLPGPSGDRRPGTAPSWASSSQPGSSQLARPESALSSTQTDVTTRSLCKTRNDNLLDKRGTAGQQVQLMANYFQLRSITDWTVYQYHAEFAPNEDRPGVRKKIMQNLKSTIGGYLFDGMILYSSQKFQSPWELTAAPCDGVPNTTQVTLQLTRELRLGEHEYLQFFNVLMRRCLAKLRLELVGRNYFDPYAKTDIREFNMELWPGYVTSIRQHEREILMCTEITHKVMRTETVHNLYCRIMKASGERNTFKDSVLGLVVLTDYNNRTYRVDDVDFEMTPGHSFDMRGGRKLTYAEYYKERYNINILDLNQPMLVSRSKPRELRAGMPDTVYLVPEVCRVTGITDEMRQNFHLMRAIANFTRVEPQIRVDKLLKFSTRLRESPEAVEELNDWSMAVNEDLVNFTGRVLPTEDVVFGTAGKERSFSAGRNVDWTNFLRKNEALNPGQIRDWAVLVTNEMFQLTSDFVGNKVRQCARDMGMMMSDPKVYRIDDDRKSTYVNMLDDILSKPWQLVVIAVPQNRTDRYAAIKKKCVVERAVPSQVVTKRAMANERSAWSVATKVAVQINCKVGGAPWTVNIPMKDTMVVGFDASHDTTHKGLSFGALVASLDPTFSRYFSAVSPHRSGEELSNDLSLNLMKGLDRFREANGCLPKRIVLYRDGVGDGQIPFVFKHEVEPLKDKLTHMYGGETWKMAFIVVSKRINTRIFTTNRGNPAPGTVVDDCITLPERYDFFVVSQSVRQGTVSPTSYNVIWDNVELEPDKLQRFSYKMTHLYYNWSGTVRVPAPVQYAHKLAALTGQHLHAAPSIGQDTTLYYL